MEGNKLANLTTATILKRLAGVLAAHPDSAFDPDDLIDDPHSVLGEVLAADIIEQLKGEVVREAMKR